MVVVEGTGGRGGRRGWVDGGGDGVAVRAREGEGGGKGERG